MAHRMLPSPADRKQLRRYLDGFPSQRILVVGDLMLDEYVRGSVSRISPEAPVPVVRVTSESFVPVGAGNVANNLAALGARVSLVGVLGDDPAGRRLSADLSGRGADTAGVIFDPLRVTSQKTRVVAERQQVVRYDRETAAPLSAESERRLLQNLEAAVAASDAVILSDYGKGVLGPRVVNAAIALSRRRRVPITVDPKVEHFKRYKRVTCVTPNLNEAFQGMGRAHRDGQEEIERLGRDILKTLRSESVLVTRGPDGMSLFRPGKVTHIPTRAQEVFDVTGAGDTVISTLTLALAAGASIVQAAELSNFAAGIVVGKLGTAVTTTKELAEVLK